MARVTLKDLRKRMRSPEVQEPMLKAVRELEDNPRAMEIKEVPLEAEFL